MVVSVRVLLADDHVRLVAEVQHDLTKCSRLSRPSKMVNRQLMQHFGLTLTCWYSIFRCPSSMDSKLQQVCETRVARHKIIILTIYEDYEHVHLPFSSGASAYITKHHFATDLVTAIREVSHGNTFISRHYVPTGRNCSNRHLREYAPRASLSRRPHGASCSPGIGLSFTGNSASCSVPHPKSSI